MFAAGCSHCVQRLRSWRTSGSTAGPAQHCQGLQREHSLNPRLFACSVSLKRGSDRWGRVTVTGESPALAALEVACLIAELQPLISGGCAGG